MQEKKLYGVDVAIRRADDLDRKALEYISSRIEDAHKVTILDIGCGAGGQSVRMADAGAAVTAVDVGGYTDSICHERVQFLQGDMRDIKEILGENQFDIAILQRTIHYLPYIEAVVLLKELRSYVRNSLYISVTGLESDIGRTYVDADKNVQDRFCFLTKEDAQVFEIGEPVCLYTPEEFMLLLQESGWSIEEYWVSAFGNIKAVCS